MNYTRSLIVVNYTPEDNTYFSNKSVYLLVILFIYLVVAVSIASNYYYSLPCHENYISLTTEANVSLKYLHVLAICF